MSKTMSMQEFITLVKHIRDEHSPRTALPPVRRIKYIDPHIDMRTLTVFAIQFRGYGWETTLHTQNECRDLPETLFTRCMTFLDTK